MSIILRTNKGSALTYDEMDRNQSQFFYSSSLHDSNSKLRLHYTGSDNLDTATEDYGPTRYHEIQFPSVDINIPDAIAAGDNTQIQFNDVGSFGADPLFVFAKVKNLLGIGTANPTDRIDIAGAVSQTAAISLRGYSAGTGNQKQAKINFYDGNTFLGRLGRTDGENQNIYLTNNYAIPLTGADFGKVHISIGVAGDDDNIVAATFTRNSSTSKFGVGTTVPNRVGTFVGSTGIGISSTSANTDQSFLTPIPVGNAPSGIYGIVNENGYRKLVPHNSDPSGLLISSPSDANGGNVVVAINTDTVSKNEGFNIINAFSGNYTNSEVIASFQASGRVGINTNFPSDIGLTVDGIISGSGNGKIDGTLTVGTIAAVTATGTNRTLVADSNGLVNSLPAAPVPFGGIIMWSGNTNAVPEGWVLCNLNSSVTTGLGTRFVPDLTNKFVIGWNGDENASGPKTDVTGADTVSGGSATYTPTGNLSMDKLTTAMVPRHTHMHLDDDHTYVANVSGYGPGTPSTLELDRYGGGTGTYNSAADINGYDADSSNSGNRQAFHTGVNTTSVRGTTPMNNSPALPTGTFTGESGNNLPPYYALAFIMYVGV